MNNSALPSAIFLHGATATGKTGLAITLSQQFPVDIISVDSAMVYRGMDIGSAKPEPEILAAAPHALVDIREPEDAYSAADFSRDALVCMETSWASGRVPLLVGGTMLYFNALEQGLSPMPAADPLIRAAIDKRADVAGWPALHTELALLDPQAAARIEPMDRQRIQRALEVCQLSGSTLSALQEQVPELPLQARILKLVLTAKDRAVLHQRIETRFADMLEAGFMAEMKALMQRPGLIQESTAMRSVGYRQAWGHLSGSYGLAELESKVVIATRQLAKRQLTWLRQLPGCMWYDWPDEDNSSHIIKQVEAFLEKPD